jgi:hypothetical protein
MRAAGLLAPLLFGLLAPAVEIVAIFDLGSFGQNAWLDGAGEHRVSWAGDRVVQ